MLVSCSNSFNCAHNQKVHFDFTRFVKKETNCNHFLKCQLEKYFLPNRAATKKIVAFLQNTTAHGHFSLIYLLHKEKQVKTILSQILIEENHVKEDIRQKLISTLPKELFLNI